MRITNSTGRAEFCAECGARVDAGETHECSGTHGDGRSLTVAARSEGSLGLSGSACSCRSLIAAIAAPIETLAGEIERKPYKELSQQLQKDMLWARDVLHESLAAVDRCEELRRQLATAEQVRDLARESANRAVAARIEAELQLAAMKVECGFISAVISRAGVDIPRAGRPLHDWLAQVLQVLVIGGGRP